MGKQSAFAKAVQREVNIQLQLYGRNRMQLAEDAAFMAARLRLRPCTGIRRGVCKIFKRDRRPCSRGQQGRRRDRICEKRP